MPALVTLTRYACVFPRNVTVDGSAQPSSQTWSRFWESTHHSDWLSSNAQLPSKKNGRFSWPLPAVPCGGVNENADAPAPCLETRT